ncbi:hypothetical protein E2C01_075636 [Portunus trituberculatus]|uniref:Uncharacterized protein n=2 Tax=Portunus trituberculatus TaxID=210409 RepID=A0A5B7IGA7_PORTR|nr:hypothetical protein [Portunus trituberculatus]
MMKKSAGRGGAGQPPLRPAPPPPPPPPAILPALPVTSGMWHLKPQPPMHVMNVVQRPILPTPTPRAKQTRKTKDPIVTTGHLATLPPCPPKILTPM